MSPNRHMRVTNEVCSDGAKSRQCRNFLLFLSDGMLTRWFCQLEIKEAIKQRVNIILVQVDPDDRREVHGWGFDTSGRRVAQLEDLPDDPSHRGRALQVAPPSFNEYFNQCKGGQLEGDISYIFAHAAIPYYYDAEGKQSNLADVSIRKILGAAGLAHDSGEFCCVAWAARARLR